METGGLGASMAAALTETLEPRRLYAAIGPDLVCQLEGSLPSEVVAGTKGSQIVRILSQGTAPVFGLLGVSLFASTDGLLDPSDVLVATAVKPVRLPPAASKTLNLRFTFPVVPDGAYQLIAQVDSSGTVAEAEEANNTAASASTVTIATPFIDLSGAFARAPVIRGKSTAVTLSLRNGGNVPARGSTVIRVFASRDSVLDNGDVLVGTAPANFNLKPGMAKRVRLKLPAPHLPSGSYMLVGEVDAGAQLAESDETNNATPPSAAVSITANSSTVVYWRFEDGAAAVPLIGPNAVVDSSGYGLSGTPSGGPTPTADVAVDPVPHTGAPNTSALDFNGLSQGVFIPDYTELALTRSLTIEAYIKVRNTLPPGSFPQQIVMRADDRSGLDPYQLALFGDQIVFAVSDEAGRTGTVSTPLPTLNRWTHVAGTLDDITGAMRLYVDGVLMAEATTPVRPFGTLDQAYHPGIGIGSVQSPVLVEQEQFDGLIDEVRISDRALSPGELLSAPVA